MQQVIRASRPMESSRLPERTAKEPRCFAKRSRLHLRAVGSDVMKGWLAKMRLRQTAAGREAMEKDTLSQACNDPVPASVMSCCAWMTAHLHAPRKRLSLSWRRIKV